MKKILLSSALVFLSLTNACTSDSSIPDQNQSRSVSMPNPFTSYGSIQEARTAFGRDFAVPSLPAGYRVADIAVAEIQGAKLAQILYEQGTRQVLYRVTPALDGNRDAAATMLSGDYNRYAEHATLHAGSSRVLVRGRDGLVFVAYWEHNGYSYCLTAQNGLPSEQVQTIVESVTR